MWQKRADTHEQKQTENIFSGHYKGDKKFDKSEYGQPVKGSETERRRNEAQAWVVKNINRLCDEIVAIGEFDSEQGGVCTVNFGKFFIHYQDISDTLGECCNLGITLSFCID